ncbi:MFS transporter [Streptomyces sp. NPDC090994]|uniref:MFS transporter n=1 Tax=Streptomyces sp. NPDC090994 TaxID=3365969 RepID=UPI00380F7D5E
MTAERVLAPTPTAAYRWRWLALTALLLGEAMNLLDATIVQVAAPAIHTDLGGSVSDVQWFTTAYTLPFAVLLITGGRLGDIAGRRRMFVVGITGFMLASAACALAPTVGLLIAFRVVQGAAAAVIIPQTIGLIKTMFSGGEMAKALGSIGPVMGLAAVCGPVLGGVLTHADLFGSSWRAVFLVNVPLSVVVLAIAPKMLEDRAPNRPTLDLTGTVLAVIGIGSVVYPLIDGDISALSGWHWAAIVAGLVVMVVFALHQRGVAASGRSPLVEPSLFTRRSFPAALVTSTCFFAVTNGLMMVIVLQLQLGLGIDVLDAGLTLAPWSVGLAVASWVAGAHLIPRLGHRTMYLGLAVFLAGALAAIAVYRSADPSAYPTPLLVALGVIGVGAGLFSPAFFSISLHPLKPQEIGTAAGLLNAVQQLGATLGVAVLGSVYLNSAASGGASASLHAIEVAFWVAVALVVVSFLTSRKMVEKGAPDSAGAQH